MSAEQGAAAAATAGGCAEWALVAAAHQLLLRLRACCTAAVTRTEDAAKGEASRDIPKASHNRSGMDSGIGRDHCQQQPVAQAVEWRLSIMRQQVMLTL